MSDARNVEGRRAESTWLARCGRGLFQASTAVVRGAADANRLFVGAAASVERTTTAAARTVAIQGAAWAPTVARRTGRLVRRAGRVAERRYDGDCNVVLESIGPASERTARILERLGAEIGGGIARGLVSVLGSESGRSAERHRAHRDLGQLVADAIRDGLELMPVARSIVSRVSELRRRDAERRRRRKEEQRLMESRR